LSVFLMQNIIAVIFLLCIDDKKIIVKMPYNLQVI